MSAYLHRDTFPRKSTAWIPARSMLSRTTNGAAAGTVELATNKTMLATLDFDKTTEEFAQFTVAFPKGWNGGTVTARFCSTAATGTQDETLDWAIQGKCLQDTGDDVMDSAWGTAVVVTSTFDGIANALKWSAETAAITLAGATTNVPALAFFQIYRKVSTDNLNEDGKLIGLQLFFTEDTHTDA